MADMPARSDTFRRISRDCSRCRRAVARSLSISRQRAGTVQRRGMRLGIIGGIRASQQRVQTAAALTPVATHVPEAPQMATHPEAIRGASVVRGPLQGRAQVVVLGLEAGQPRGLLGALEPFVGLNGHVAVPGEVAGAEGRRVLVARWQLLDRVLADRLE